MVDETTSYSWKPDVVRFQDQQDGELWIGDDTENR